MAIALLAVLLPIVLGQDSSIPENPLRGRFVLEQKGCLSCHAINGEGGNIGSDLGQRKFYGSFLELASIMWNHSPEMARRMRELDLRYPRFSRQEITELIAYLYYLRYLGEPGDLYRGRLLVKEKGCLTCHSVGGKGGDSAPAFDQLAKYVSPLFLAQALWNHGPEMDKQIREKGLQRPTFQKGEIVDLSAYIRYASLETAKERLYMPPGNPAQGLNTLREKNCLACHAIDGRGSAIGPDFGQTQWNMSVTEIAALMWNHGSQMAQMMEQKGIGWPMFSGPEMADLIAYLYFLGFEDQAGDEKAGERLFGEKGCSYCHTPTGPGPGIAPDLANLKALSSPADMAPVMWNHAPVMEEKVAERIINWPKLSGAELRDLYAFLLKQSQGAKTE